MENANKELQEDRRKNHYVVETKRDTKLMLTFIEFKNRVEHPAATVYSNWLYIWCSTDIDGIVPEVYIGVYDEE